MADFKLVYNGNTKVARILASGGATPTGFVDAGTFKHEGNDDPLGVPVGHNHAVFQHVRNLLYKLNPSVQNMQATKIEAPGITFSKPAPG